MFKKKSLLSLSMILALAAAAGCGDDAKEPSPTPKPTTALSTPTPKPTEATEPEVPEATPTPIPTPAASYTPGYVVDFEDGNYSFIKVKETNGDSAEVELSVVDFGGSKALKVVAPDTSKVPYVAIDVSSLAGDALESVRSIEMDIGISHASGKFYAVSGLCYYYVGEKNEERKDATWSVYLEAKNPKRAVFKLGENDSFKLGAKNIIMITKNTDLASDPNTGEGAASEFYIDNIVLKDADGKEIALNTKAEFDPPLGFGDKDWTNLTPVENEVQVSGMAGETTGGWWPVTGISTDPAQTDAKVVDASIFGPGKIMTIYMTFPDGIEDWQKNFKIVGQWYTVENSEIPMPTWEDFNTPDVADCSTGEDEQGRPTKSFSIYNLKMNETKTIAQIDYDTIASYLGDDEWFKYVKFFGLADFGANVNFSSVTVGDAKPAEAE